MPIIVGEYRVHPVSYLRCLGFIIDSTLCFSPHVSKTLSSCFATLRQLHSIRRSITQSLAISLVTSLVFPKLDYCIAALSGLTELQYSRLQSIINASARFVRKLPLHARISPTLHELHWSSIKTRIKTRSAILVLKCLRCSPCLPNGDVPSRKSLPGSISTALSCREFTGSKKNSSQSDSEENV